MWYSVDALQPISVPVAQLAILMIEFIISNDVKIFKTLFFTELLRRSSSQ